jgi:competence protein ComEA
MTSQYTPNDFGSHHHQFDIAHQQTISCPAVPPFAFTEQLTQPLDAITTELSPSHNHAEDKLQDEREEATKKLRKLRPLIILAIIGFGCALYFIWRTPTTNSSAAAPTISQSFSKSTVTAQKDTNSTITTAVPTNTIQVYVTGAVQHPGVYTLSSDARIYQLLQVAGGPLPDANLVALNLAEKLVDGQEVYVSKVGETPPITNSTDTSSSTTSNSTSANQGQLVNINSASESDLKQKLHLSTKSAQGIINYRQLHPFTSVDQLLQVVSQAIYNKIKNLVTV